MENLKDKLIEFVEEKKQATKVRKEERIKEEDRQELQSLIAKADAMSPEERKVFAEEMHKVWQKKRNELIDTQEKVRNVPKTSTMSDVAFTALFSGYVAGGTSLAVCMDQLFANNLITVGAFAVIMSTAMSHLVAINKNAFNKHKEKKLTKQANELTREMLIHEKLASYLDENSDTMER